VGKKVVIIDDMIDTGGTLVSACEKLRVVGVAEIYILVTHGLFTGRSWLQLWSLGVRRIFCTDTVPLRSDVDAANISIVSAIPLIRAQLLQMDKGTRQMTSRVK
jgi:ribose-phosphate pyrophosphokinase